MIVLVTDEGDTAVRAFVKLWEPVYNLDGIEIGTVDGAGLSQGGDGATLFLGGPTAETKVNFAAYPDAKENGGQSFDVAMGNFSETTATVSVNDEGQPAVGTPGNQGPVDITGDIPEITLLGDNPYITTLGADFEDPGATAYDTEDGDLTDSIVVTGYDVDTAAFDEFEITYDVTDSDGNEAAPAVRKVIVTHPETVPVAPEPANPDMFTHVATLGGSCRQRNPRIRPAIPPGLCHQR